MVDNFDGITAVGPTYQIDVDEQRANLLGLTADTVQHWLETAVTGTVVGQVLEGDRAVPLRLRYPDAYREQLETVDDLTLVASQDRLAPLRSVAHLGAGPLAVQRTRENLRQLVRVTARLSERDLGAATADVQRRLGRDLHLPAGVTLEYGGLYASQQQAFAELLVVFMGAVACVAALLLVEFGSVAAVVAIVVGSSLALSGSLVSLWVTGTALNVSSIVGMIMVVGIVAKNGILLLDFAGREYRHTGDVEAALINAGRRALAADPDDLDGRGRRSGAAGRRRRCGQPDAATAGHRHSGRRVAVDAVLAHRRAAAVSAAGATGADDDGVDRDLTEEIHRCHR